VEAVIKIRTPKSIPYGYIEFRSGKEVVLSKITLKFLTYFLRSTVRRFKLIYYYTTSTNHQNYIFSVFKTNLTSSAPTKKTVRVL